MTTLNARNLTLDEVHRLLHFRREVNGSFTPLLTLEPLTEQEQQELVQIRNDFEPYLDTGKISEGVVKAMTIFPLLRLAGFYHPPMRFRIEEGIGEIATDDEDTRITGRFDIVAVDCVRQTSLGTPFWILVVEAKEGSFSPWVGLPQLLTYAYKSLQTQSTVWGLVATGSLYQFVYLEAGETPIYRLMPLLNLFETAETDRLLQVLKAIRRSEYAA